MDLDQVIVAVEVLRHPESRGQPIIVGGHGDPPKRGLRARRGLALQVMTRCGVLSTR